MKRAIQIGVALAVFATTPAFAQRLSHAGCAGPGDPVDPALLERPIPLRSGIGWVHQEITASSPEAQAYYDQGLTLLHHYVFIDAARSFHEAIRRDADCAMCWMGLARAEQGLERSVATAAAIDRATALAARATPAERTFIALRAQQIDAQAAPPSEEKEKHAAYKAALDRALGVHPEDAELWILRGNAEEPGPWGRGQFGGAASIAFYETALARSPGHLVGHHAEAAEHGKVYAGSSPSVAHAQHMYGHVLPRLGRWEEALAQFEKADALEEAYAREQKLRPGDDWHHVHNLQLLGYAYLRLGRIPDAEKTFRRAVETPIRYPRFGREHATLAEYLLLRGRPEEALAAARALRNETGAAKAAGAAVEGETLLALNRVPEAREAATRAHAAFEEAKKGAGYEAAWIERMISPYLGQLDAELAFTEKESSTAEDSLRKVADELAANPRFDAWGEGLFRLERIAEQAKRSGRAA